MSIALMFRKCSDLMGLHPRTVELLKINARTCIGVSERLGVASLTAILCESTLLLTKQHFLLA